MRQIASHVSCRPRWPNAANAPNNVLNSEAAALVVAVVVALAFSVSVAIVVAAALVVAVAVSALVSVSVAIVVAAALVVAVAISAPDSVSVAIVVAAAAALVKARWRRTGREAAASPSKSLGFLRAIARFGSEEELASGVPRTYHQINMQRMFLFLPVGRRISKHVFGGMGAGEGDGRDGHKMIPK